MNTLTIPSAFLAIGVFLAAAPAFAHGKLSQTTPADGATLAALPEQIAIRFEQPHRVTLVQISSDNADPIRLTTNEGLEPSKAVTASPPTLNPGAYRLEWRALAPDGHATKGAAAFTYAPQ